MHRVTAEELEQIEKLARRGVTTAAIAKELGLTPQQVRRKASEMQLPLRREYNTRCKLRFPIDEDVYQQLSEYAQQHDDTCSHLARITVETVVRANLFEAVLGDGLTQPKKVRRGWPIGQPRPSPAPKPVPTPATPPTMVILTAFSPTLEGRC